tara:strand:- start:1490 stop:3688 length:2199 start_codon:yes stop_codon:yes gene_type:complete
MRVKVPRDLAGGSLLKAHQWVKSSVAKSNPHSSTSDYKIQSVDGTPLTLSDLTSRTYDEVLVLTGARSNPYPVPQENWGYPSYKSNKRLGNKVTKLLAKDLDPSMVERLAAQNGMFSALNTVTKLLYTTENKESGTDPKIAALLQTYANAMAVKKNPGRPFFATGINDTFRGVVSPQEAVRGFISEEFGIPSELGKFDPRGNEATSYIIEKAKIVNMYDLDNPDNMNEFVDDVLTPFLAVSMSNAGLLKAMQHQDYIEVTNKQLEKSKDGPKWQKLISMVPTRAEEFYDGMDYGLVAHPLFLRNSLGLAVMNEKLIKHIAKIVEKYPQNAKDAQNSRTIKKRRSIWATITDSFQPENDLMWGMVKSQSDIMRDGTTPEETMEALKEIFDRKTRDTDIAKYAQSMKSEFLVSYQKDIAGFRPTAPPYWPKPVVLALMDTLRNHIHQLIDDRSLDISKALMPLSIMGAGILPSAFRTLEQKHMRLTNSEALRQEKVRILTESGRNSRIKAQWRDKSNKFKNKDVSLTAKWSDTDIREATDEIGQILNEERTWGDTELPQRTIHLLSVFMEIEETTRSKYNYTMSENDRAFALYMLDSVVSQLRNKTEGATGEEVRSDGSSSMLERYREVYQGDGGNAGKGNDSQQFLKQMKLLALIDDAVVEARAEIFAASEDRQDAVRTEARNNFNNLVDLQNKAGVNVLGKTRWATDLLQTEAINMLNSPYVGPVYEQEPWV